MFWWDLNEEAWTAFAKFALFWWVVFQIAALSVSTFLTNPLFYWENQSLVFIFAGIQTYSWISR